MQINIDDTIKECFESIINNYNDLKPLNVIIMGKSGIGKSTLINTFFREELAETGIGDAVTDKITKITKKSFPLTIYDTPGLELSKEQQEKVTNEVFSIIDEGFKSKDISKAIHCIWYCIDTTSLRIDKVEIELIKKITEIKKTPVIVVLTKAFSEKDTITMKSDLEKRNLNIVKVVPVLADDYEINSNVTIPAYGLKTLVKVMEEVLPDYLQNTFQNVQNVDVGEKVKRARAILATALAASFGEGFAPVPFADAIALIPTQLAMLAGITKVFGIDIKREFMKSFAYSIFSVSGATILGKSVVSGILKLIPGVGTVAGGAISGSTAALITGALGGVYIKIMEMIWKGEIEEKDLYTKKFQKGVKLLLEKELKERKEIK